MCEKLSGNRGSQKPRNRRRPGARSWAHAASPVVPLSSAWANYHADAAVSVPNRKKRIKISCDYSGGEKERFDLLAKWGLRDTPTLL
jgi:hypothetical protein